MANIRKLFIIFLCQVIYFGLLRDSLACNDRQEMNGLANKLLIKFDCKSNCMIDLNQLRNKFNNRNYEFSLSEKYFTKGKEFLYLDNQDPIEISEKRTIEEGILPPPPLPSKYKGYYSLIKINFDKEIKPNEYIKMKNFIRKYIKHLGFKILEDPTYLCN